MTAIVILAWREVVRFARQPARIAAAIGTPALMWLLLASGLSRAVRPEALSTPGFAAFLLPGMMSLVAVFASVFASIPLIEDRNAGWLQAVLVSPAPRWALAAGKLLGGAALAWAQAMLLMAMVPFVAPEATLLGVAESALAVALTSVAITALGLSFAWRSETVAGFHAVMNLVLMPMWLLSSAIFPLAGAAPALAWIMRLNPLTWCTEAVRAPLGGAAPLPALALTAGFAALTTAVALVVMNRP
jgi:ABC-2 type transport system permease protein